MQAVAVDEDGGLAVDEVADGPALQRELRVTLERAEPIDERVRGDVVEPQPAAGVNGIGPLGVLGR